jgi:hypothetical protein
MHPQVFERTGDYMESTRLLKSMGIKVLMLSLGIAAASSALSLDGDSLKPNVWYSKKPAYQFLPNLSGGHYQDRGWCTLRYHEKNKSVIFYEGYTRDQDCIYANSLYEYSPGKDTIHMRTISNWNCREHTVGPALSANAINPTPMDRHTYAQFTYVPRKNKVYMAHGAMGNNNHQHDLWAWDFDSSKWENLGVAPGGTQAWECICALNLIYSPVTDELYFFASQKAVYAYNVETNKWRSITPKNATTKDIGGHGLYDSKRNRFAFYGNNWTASDAGSQVFLTYDPVANAWTELPVTETWPPAKSYASLEYNSLYDIYMLHGGWRQNDTWLWNPRTLAWKKVVSPELPTAITNRGTYTTYSPDHNVLITYSAQTMWFLKVDPQDGSVPLRPKNRDNQGGSSGQQGIYFGQNFPRTPTINPLAVYQVRDLRNREIHFKRNMDFNNSSGLFIFTPNKVKKEFPRYDDTRKQ